MSKEELADEAYNFNIRRFVDNAPPAEPHDVHAHLHGAILLEFEAMGVLPDALGIGEPEPAAHDQEAAQGFVCLACGIGLSQRIPEGSVFR